MESKGNRKVRFTLPGLENYVIFGNNNNPYQTAQQHGTSRYINGTLVTPVKPQKTTEDDDKFDLTFTNKNQEIVSSSNYNNNLILNPDRKISNTTTEELNLDIDVPTTSQNIIQNNVEESMANRKTKLSTNYEIKPPIRTTIQNVKSLTNLTNNKVSSTENISNKSEINNLNKNKKYGLRNKTSDELQSLIMKEEEDDENLNKNYNQKKTTKVRIKTVKPIGKTGYFNFNYLKHKCDLRKNSVNCVDNKNIKNKIKTINNCPEIKVSLSEQNNTENHLIKRTKIHGVSSFLAVPNLTDDNDNIQNLKVLNFRTQQNSNFLNFLERWSCKCLAANKKTNFLCEAIGNSATSSVSKQICIKTDVKRSLLTKPFRSIKMSLEKIPYVTKLLRASREANEILLQHCLEDILQNGITKDELNASDLNGRTAISYICSTNLTNILDNLLRVPHIDVNKADNEGNCPLHFAAQAGFCDIINMLLTRSRSINVDAKNNLGFTPLMKAALQGRNKCAKLLLFAGASPLEVDAGRGLRAEQWAKFCGRYSCAEMIEKCARSRLLGKSASCRLPHETLTAVEKTPVFRSKTNPPASTNNGTIRSKFRKVFPFGFSLREKSNNSPKNLESGTDILTYLTAAALCASSPVLPNHGNSAIIKSFIRPLEVPKLEVTPANNQALIKKYENAKYFESDDPIPTQTARWKYKY